MIPIVVTVSRKGEYTVVAIKQMGILKEERVAGGVGCHRRLGCGGGCRKGWEGERGGAEAVVIVVVVGRGGGGGFGHCLKIRKEEFGDLAQDMELGEDGGRHSGWGRWW